MAYLLGIDIGTSGTKTLICDEKGKVLATAWRARLNYCGYLPLALFLPFVRHHASVRLAPRR